MKPLDFIDEKEPEMYEAIKELIDYVSNTYKDKYEKSPLGNPAKQILYSKDGKAANLFTAIKYIQRYSTEGFDKSDDPDDLKKAIHYLLFELVRVNRKKPIGERVTDIIVDSIKESTEKFLKDEPGIGGYTWGWCTTCSQPIPHTRAINCTKPNCPQLNEE